MRQMMGGPPTVPDFSAEELVAAFNAFASLKADLAPRALQQPYPASRVVQAFTELREPLARARCEGGRLNPWSIAGLKRDEVRVAQVLRGLWSIEFGGIVSRDFLRRCLAMSMGQVDWLSELEGGYRVDSEISPVGLQSERVDLVVETARHVVGVEMKIDAGLGRNQLERYVGAVRTRAGWRHAAAHVVLLAPFPSPLAQVPHWSWQQVAEAAWNSARAAPAPDGFAARLIASFGDYVNAFSERHAV